MNGEIVLEVLRGRFAPSPSGRMHIGNVFCALMAWLSVKSQGGEMILRIEDLDTARCRREYAEQLMDDLQYLGLSYDADPVKGGAHAPYFQSERTEFYEQALRTLEEKGLVYPCYCSRDEIHAVNAPHASDGRVLYNGACRYLTPEQRLTKRRTPSVRMKAADCTYSFKDGLYGDQQWNVQREWGDFVLRRSDGLFAYQLAVVVDDAAMGITQVLRGRDLLSSVAPQLQLYEALELTPPQFIHIPLLVNDEGRRLSKRDKDLDMGELRKRYTTPEPLIGKLMYLAGFLQSYEAVSLEEALGLYDPNKLLTSDIAIQNDDFV